MTALVKLRDDSVEIGAGIEAAISTLQIVDDALLDDVEIAKDDLRGLIVVVTSHLQRQREAASTLTEELRTLADFQGVGR